jgi:hypothetical protein
MNHLDSPTILQDILKTAYRYDDNPIYASTMSAHLRQAYSKKRVPSTINPTNIRT